ncbi:MAG: hypothetical protein KatS3mg050_4391 [Litorilinea sp.]|nr:MAG: hypothetical protein KatS3mg050_4391 [Litorilinea sp.]
MRRAWIAGVGAAIAWLTAALSALAAQSGPSFTLDPPTVVFINEIHYDNAGTDTGEAVEIVAPAGTDLSAMALVFYNGANGTVYRTVAAPETATGQCGDYDVYVIKLSTNGIQNDMDGIALVNTATDTLVQFLSYEGSFTAADGPAAGYTSTDIGVQESNSTPISRSLQLSGPVITTTTYGSTYNDFTWHGPISDTFGACNTGQMLTFPPTLVTLLAFDARVDGETVHLMWESGVEVDNAGFHLYRARDSAGPYRRITEQLIAPRAEPGQGARYHFTDRPGPGTHFYQLEDVDNRGVATRHGPIQVTLLQTTALSHGPRLYLPHVQR